MADQSPDQGKVTFGVDLSTGVVKVGVRPPLFISAVECDMSLLDFLDYAAQITLKLNEAHREAAARMVRPQ